MYVSASHYRQTERQTGRDSRQIRQTQKMDIQTGKADRHRQRQTQTQAKKTDTDKADSHKQRRQTQTKLTDTGKDRHKQRRQTKLTDRQS